MIMVRVTVMGIQVGLGIRFGVCVTEFLHCKNMTSL